MTTTRTRRRWLAIVATILVTIVGAAGAAGYIGGKTVKVRIMHVDGKSRHVLTTHDGITLYYSPKDSATSTHCGSSCGGAWRPFTLLGGTGRPTASVKIRVHLSLLQVAPREYQVEYNGHPLYTYAKDKEPGDTKGAGQGPFRVATVALGKAPGSVPNSGPSSVGGG